MLKQALAFATAITLAITPALAEGAAPSQKVATAKSELNDGILKIRVVDMTPRFLDFFNAANRPGVDAAQRWRLWNERYGFAAVPPTPEGDAMARQILESAWPRYPSAMPVIMAGAAGLKPEPMTVLRQIVGVLKPDKPVDITVLAYVGGFDGNAFSFRQEGQPTVAIPTEMDVQQRTLIFPHEMTHAVHMSIAGGSGGWERTIAATLIQEGLAMHVSRAVVPGRDVRYYVERVPGWWDSAQGKRRAILEGIMPVLDRKDGQTVFRFTMGQGATGLEREAYAAGWWVIEELTRQGMSLADIARVKEDDMPALANRAITQLLRQR